MLPKHNPGSAIADGHTHLTTPVLPVYISGVLAVFDKASRTYMQVLLCVCVQCFPKLTGNMAGEPKPKI